MMADDCKERICKVCGKGIEGRAYAIEILHKGGTQRAGFIHGPGNRCIRSYLSIDEVKNSLGAVILYPV